MNVLLNTNVFTRQVLLTVIDRAMIVVDPNCCALRGEIDRPQHDGRTRKTNFKRRQGTSTIDLSMHVLVYLDGTLLVALVLTLVARGRGLSVLLFGRKSSSSAFKLISKQSIKRAWAGSK